jgi:hypothetical protein
MYVCMYICMYVHARLISKSILLTHSNSSASSDATDGGEYVENKANR